MATTDYSHGQQHLAGACPQCGAAALGTETHCRYCQTAINQPTPMAPPPMMSPPMVSQPMYYPTVQIASSRGWAAYWIIIAIVTVIVPLAIVGVVMFSVHSSVDSFTTPTFVAPSFPAPNTPADPSAPAVSASTVDGNGQTKTLDCSTGQNYVITGNAMNVTASGGVCGTIIVKGHGTTVKLDGAKETWVTGNSDTVSVTQAGKITTTGNVDHVTYAGGIDGAEPTIQQGGTASTITKVG